MIREGKREDGSFIREMIMARAREWSVEEDSGVPIDPPTIDAVLRFHLRSKDAVVLVNEDDGIVNGFFVGALLPHYMDIRRHVAHEKISGGKNHEELWNKFKEWAKEQDAPACIRSCYDPKEGSRFRRV